MLIVAKIGNSRILKQRTDTRAAILNERINYTYYLAN